MKKMKVVRKEDGLITVEITPKKGYPFLACLTETQYKIKKMILKLTKKGVKEKELEELIDLVEKNAIAREYEE